MMRTRIAVAASLAFIVLGTCSFAAEDPAAAGRQIAEKFKDAVVRVQLVTQMSMSMDGRESKRESKSEIVGTVIDPSGLTVMSLAATNPTEALSSMGFGDRDGIDFKSQVTDVKIRMTDGTEIPAKIVLRDKDLDLAFVRPTQKPAKPMQCVDLEQSVRPQLLDHLVVLGRLGKVANRTLSVSLDRVQAIVEKPRTFFVPGTISMMSDMGAPVFDIDGKAVGMLVLRTVPKYDGDEGGFSLSSSGMLPMVLPAADILKVAKQAPENAPKTAAASKPAAKPAAPKKK